MTPTNDAPVTVEDRIAAWPLRSDCYKAADKETWIAGAYDAHRAIQAMASHRLAALASAPAHPSLELCVQFSDDGQHIRKWSRIPFDGGECLYSHPASAPAGDHVPDAGNMIAPAGDGVQGLARMTAIDDEMGLPDEPMPLSPNAVPDWHGEAVHKAMLASSEPVDPVSDEAILDLAVDTLAREWEKDRNPIYADMIRKGEDVHRSSLAIRAMVAFAAALARPRAAVGEQSREAIEAECAALIAAYYRREIGTLMQQAEHWAENGKPLAVHPRVMKADDYFQIVCQMERDPAKGWKLPFDEIRDALGRKPIKDPGTYPPSKDLYRYRDPSFVVAALQAPPAKVEG